MATSHSITVVRPARVHTGSVLLGTGLAFASLILVPAFAARVGMGAALTGAMRIALMRASSRVVTGAPGGEAAPSVSCH